jgi:4-oxalocrotonate tautomerase
LRNSIFPQSILEIIGQFDFASAYNLPRNTPLLSTTEEKQMPVVNVALYAGRTDEQKADLAKAITKAISDTAGVPDSATTIIFQDVEKASWAVGGVMASEI